MNVDNKHYTGVLPLRDVKLQCHFDINHTILLLLMLVPETKWLLIGVTEFNRRLYMFADLMHFTGKNKQITNASDKKTLHL